MITEYRKFVESKNHCGAGDEIPFKFSPDGLFDFQEHIVRWSLNKGRSAIFADCGLGKTIMELTWAQNISYATNKPVLILAPLAVSHQTTTEGEKFGIECIRARDGIINAPIQITNYERLHHFSPDDFSGVICDESSILKSFNGAYKNQITEFLKKVRYRLLATATAAPNDYTELGTSSEALGNIGLMDMLNRYFKNDLNNSGTKRFYGEAPKWRFKGHSESPFWRWVTSWAMACRYPSDLGFDDDGFILPELTENRIMIDARAPRDDMLFDIPATNLHEQRIERKRTIGERCEAVAELVDHNDYAMVWCHLNDEGNLLEKLIPGCIQVSGRDSDEAKERKLTAFAKGEARVLVSKPKIGAWGLNLQHCNHVTFFPSHSYEQYYQSIRRCWRFGQKRPVKVDVVMTKGDERVMQNMQRKKTAAQKMFSNLVSEMSRSTDFRKINDHTNIMEAPSWL